MAEEPQWQVTVRVPMRLPVEQRQALFEAICAVVSDWEPDDRDGWDADAFGCPEADAQRAVVANYEELESALNGERSSRQAWAAEAERLQADLDEIMRPAIWDLPHAYRNNGSGEHGTPGDCRTCGRPDFDDLHEPPEPPKITVCACISDDQASQLGPGFTRPVCAVHEQKDASDA